MRLCAIALQSMLLQSIKCGSRCDESVSSDWNMAGIMMNGLPSSNQNSINIMANVTWTFANLHLSSTLNMPTTGSAGQMIAAIPHIVENIPLQSVPSSSQSGQRRNSQVRLRLQELGKPSQSMLRADRSCSRLWNASHLPDQ